ncbi:cation:proton antiporter [Melioribacteraceae bacterium 4301-Me]|uniref:cation:proton antiporter n=1 Tax=Pyranulibacter aquaticus TaxID=3163344 RepID=UPI0035950360
MTAIIRRFFIIGILFGIFLFVQTIQVTSTAIIHPRTLASLGFIILASFAFGEVFALLKLPRVIGYILIGIFFGPYSHFIFNTTFLEIFNLKILEDLNLVNNVTLSIIALIAGMELKIANIRNFIKPISLILLFKVIFIFTLVTLLIYLASPFIPFLINAGWQAVISSGLILSVIALGTSIELTLVVANDSNAKGRFIDLILGTAIVKDLLIILLLAVVLTISVALTSPTGILDTEVFVELSKELLLSLVLGVFLGAASILYLKYVNAEMLIYILALVIFGSQISNSLHLETLVVFVAAGFIIKNYSKDEVNFHNPLEKLSLPVFITFFTVVGASINLVSVTEALLIGLVIFVIRGLALFFSVRIASKISKETKEVIDYGWLGFFSIGGLILGLSIIIAERLPGLGDGLKSLITSLAALNIFIGPIFLKIGIIKAKKVSDEREALTKTNIPADEVKKEAEEKIPKKLKQRFVEPNLADEKLNSSLYNILFKVNDILTQFDRKFIQSRGEESTELVISLTEKYTEEYQALRNAIIKPGASPFMIRNEILKAQKNIADWLIALSIERKQIESHILRLEPLVQELFYSFIDLTDGLQTEYYVELEKEKYTIAREDSFYVKYRKFLYRTKLFVNRIFNKHYKLLRKIDYKNLAKYYLVGESSQEILEAVNLVGVERLTTLRIVKSFYSQMNHDLEELIKLLIEERDNPVLSNILLEKLDEIHQQTVNAITVYTSQINSTTEEISNRLYYAIANPFNHLIETLKTAGTYEYKEKNFRFSKVYYKSETAKEIALQSIRYWALYYFGILGLFQKEAYINRLKVRIYEIVNSSLIGVSEEINNNLRITTNNLAKKISAFSNELPAYETKPANELETIFITKKDDEFLNTINKHIKTLESIKASRKISLFFENLIKGLTEIVNELPDKIELLEETELEFKNRTPQAAQLKTIPLRDAAKSLLSKKLPREISEVNELLINQLNLISIEVKNFVLIVTFHFDSAVKEIRNNGMGIKVALDLSKSFCEKMLDRISQINQLIDSLEHNIITKVNEKVDSIIKETNELILKRSSWDIELFVGKEKRKIKLFLYLQKTTHTISYLLRKYSIAIKRGYKKYFQDIIHDLLVKYHLKKVKIEEISTENVLQIQSNLEKLPYIYKKLFDGTPLETSDFYIGQDEVQAAIQFVLNNFINNRKSSIILIGEPGSGKRSLVNSIVNTELSDKNFIRYSFDETVTDRDAFLRIVSELLGYKRTLSTDELISLLNDRTNKRIIILENLNKLFLKKIGGYDALNTFKYILAVTSHNTLWLCSIGKYSWDFIDKNFSFGDLFERKIFINALHRKDVKSIILKRHSATGYGIEFIPDQIQRFRSKIIKPRSVEEEQRKLSEEYFNRLEEYSEGNIVVAMYYWLLSIEKIKENKIYIKSPKKIVSKVLSNMDHLYHLTLSVLLLHGSLTDYEHAEIFRVPIETSQEILNTLVSLNLIRKDQIEVGGNIYFINKFLFKIIENELVRRNIR